jgi:hypothetical protein
VANLFPGTTYLVHTRLSQQVEGTTSTGITSLVLNGKEAASVFSTTEYVSANLDGVVRITDSSMKIRVQRNITQCGKNQVFPEGVCVYQADLPPR